MAREVIKIWILSFLKRLGMKTPNFLSSLFDELPVSNKAKQIMKLRYIEKLSWDNIPDKVFYSKSRVMQIHKHCIDILIHLTF